MAEQSSKPQMMVQEWLCVGCGHCQSMCPTGAVRVTDVAVIDHDRCVACGACAGRCPMGAIVRC